MNPKNGAMNSSTSIRLKKGKGFPGGKEAFCVKWLKFLVPIVQLLYDVEYTEQGDFKSITPRFEDVPAAGKTHC